MSVAACIGVRDPPVAHLFEWLTFHTRIGVAHFFFHDDHSQSAVVERLVQSEPHATLLPTSGFPWREEASLGLSGGLRARFVGQTDFLLRCASAASGMPHLRWLANLDLDEFLMPTAMSRLRSLAENVADAAGGASCISIRRHNFYTNSTEPSNSPLHSRTLRAPFPPVGPASGQPFLPKWILRLPAEHGLVVNMHEVWRADRCRQSCAPHGAAADREDSGGDPAGLSGYVVPAARIGGRDVQAVKSASLTLLAALLSPLNTHCMQADTQRCVLINRTISMRDDAEGSALQASLVRCLANAAPAAGSRGTPPRDPWCWRSVCARGQGVDARLRINHYGHPPVAGQLHSYDLEKAGEPVVDVYAQQWFLRSSGATGTSNALQGTSGSKYASKQN